MRLKAGRSGLLRRQEHDLEYRTGAEPLQCAGIELHLASGDTPSDCRCVRCVVGSSRLETKLAAEHFPGDGTDAQLDLVGSIAQQAGWAMERKSAADGIGPIGKCMGHVLAGEAIMNAPELLAIQSNLDAGDASPAERPAADRQPATDRFAHQPI